MIKLKERATAATKRAREVGKEEQDALITLGTSVGLALLRKNGVDLPTVMNLNPYVLYGAVGYFLTRKSKSAQGRAVRQMSLTAAAIGAHSSTLKGSLKVGEDDDDDDDSDDDD